ncbi:MAG: amidase [Alphaproteobacteria bacterium]|nr:amidase [Alphaproteobacteria bacterium]
MDSIAKLSKQLRGGKRDVIDLTEDVLAAISASDDQSIFVEVLATRARTEAKAARRRLKAGTPASALDGIPIGWKDLFDIKGRPTTAGSVVLKSAPPATVDAGLVAAGKAAGLITIGALNMTEFAYSGIGMNPHYGTPRNPHDAVVPRIPGGSSSGSGVAVAKGLLPIAFGTDTGGSVRIPAALNGVVGYKASTGHYDMRGVFPLSKTLDSLGPLAQTVEDCELIDRVLRGRKKALPKHAVKGQRFIIPTSIVFDGVEAAVAENFEDAIKRIAKAGGKIERRQMPVFEKLFALLKTKGSVLGPEVLHQHWERVHGPDAASMDPRVVQRILAAERVTAVDLLEIIERRQLLIAQHNAAIAGAFMLFPTVPHVAMDMRPLEADKDVFFTANAKTLRNTLIGNFLEGCGLAMPTGLDADGLPTSILLSAAHGQDEQLLGLGLAIETLVRG